MGKWKCCIKEPPETGKKVLCHHDGDIYVGYRIKDLYIPMPFADHYFATRLSKPKTWCEIDFPPGLTGHTRVMLPCKADLLTLAELESQHPKEFDDFAKMLISSIGAIKKPEGMK